jgi:putative PIN family toxin of toxin-antitoxin system
LRTSVIVSAVLIPSSLPRAAFDLAAATGRLLVSEPTIAELDDVLRRPHFNRYVSEQQRLEFLYALVEQADIVPIMDRIAACRDPKDNKFLELAVPGRASHIISGDADLLCLHPFQGIAIVRPADFLMQFKS